MLYLNSRVMVEVSSLLDELVGKEDKEKFPILKLLKVCDSHCGLVKKIILDHLWQLTRHERTLEDEDVQKAALTHTLQ